MASSHAAVPQAAQPSDCVEVRLQSVEEQVKDLRASRKVKGEDQGKDWIDRAEKLSSVLWPVVTLAISLFVTQRIENAIKERELHLENIKDMQQLMQDFSKATPEAAGSYALALGAHGRYAVAPLILALQDGIAGHRDAAVMGLQAAAAIEPGFVCKQLIVVIANRTRLYQVEVHESAAKLLGDLNCRDSIKPLSDYVARLKKATADNAPFSPIPGTTAVTPANIDDVKKQAQTSLDVLTRP